MIEDIELEGIELSELESSETTVVQLTHPKDDERLIPVFVSGYTPDSDQYRSAQKKLVKNNDKPTMIMPKRGSKDNAKMEVDIVEPDLQRKMLAEMVTDIKGLLIKGKPWEFSTENVIKLFEAGKTAWIGDQWSAHLDDRANFFDGPENSANSGSSVLHGSTPATTE